MNASYGVWRGKQSVSLGHLRKNADRTAPLSLWAEPDGPASLSPLTMRSSSGGEAPDLATHRVLVGPDRSVALQKLSGEFEAGTHDAGHPRRANALRRRQDHVFYTPAGGGHTVGGIEAGGLAENCLEKPGISTAVR
ncbi:hypothetical protein J3A74_006545 [Rhodococcus sp. PvP104]|nr:hypothetical protein [Rhodococcus sp. PvP104]